MGDDPVPALAGRTPLQLAAMPAIRRVAALGNVRLVQTVPDGMAPGSDVANMGLLGYNAKENYTGRAAIEAAGARIPLAPDDVAYRTNLVTVRDGVMEDYSAGDISTEEGCRLIRDLDAAAAREGLRFNPGVSYRHLLIWNGGPLGLALPPPPPNPPPPPPPTRPVAPYPPSGPRAEEMLALMDLSKRVFDGHPVNAARIAAGKRPATQIWPWGFGKAMRLQPYRERYGLSGAVITAVDLVRGLAELCGLEVVRVPGATGWIDTDYAGKGAAAIDALSRSDFVYVHVEAPDECGHKGMPQEKIGAIDAISAQIVDPVWRALERAGQPYRLVVCTDHRTPVMRRGHTADPVPFAWLDGPVGLDAIDVAPADAAFDESVAPPPEGLPLVCNLMDSLLRS